jgi:hypothetical protein
MREMVRPFGRVGAAFLAGAWLLCPAAMPAEVVSVRFTEGVVHGFLALRTLDGKTLADGDLIQFARGDRVTSRLLFRFKDGSIHDETVVFSQRQTFRVLSDHLIQKGPAFPHPVDVTIDAGSGQVTVRYTDKDGHPKVAAERLDLPPDLANGLLLTLLKNIRPTAPQTTVSMVATTPKPRLVKLVITPAGEEPFTTGSSTHKAMHYVVKMDLGGIAGVVAPLIGKQPPDSHVWILGGEATAFVGSEGSLAMDAPPWRIDLVTPVWPKTVPTAKR